MTLETSLRKSPVHQNPSQSSVCSSFFGLLFLFLFFGSFLFVLEGFFLFWSVVLGFYENWMNTLDNRVGTISYPHVGIPKRVNKPWAISNDAERTEVQQTQSLLYFLQNWKLKLILLIIDTCLMTSPSSKPIIQNERDQTLCSEICVISCLYYKSVFFSSVKNLTNLNKKISWLSS